MPASLRIGREPLLNYFKVATGNCEVLRLVEAVQGLFERSAAR